MKNKFKYLLKTIFSKLNWYGLKHGIIIVILMKIAFYLFSTVFYFFGFLLLAITIIYYVDKMINYLGNNNFKK